MSAEEQAIVDVNANKQSHLRRTMSESDEALVALLLETLPQSQELDAAGVEQLNRARSIMAELWLRCVDIREFYEETGLNGAPRDVLPEGFARQKFFSAPGYFKVFLSQKNAASCADGIKQILLGRKITAGEWAGEYRVLFFIDIDSDNKECPSPYHSGLTPHAICFDVNMTDVESCSMAIDAAAATLVEKSIHQVRFGIGQFGPLEYPAMRGGYLYTKRMMFNMGSEWILVKNIARRAGKFGWFWRLVARRYERFDNPKW